MMSPKALILVMNIQVYKSLKFKHPDTSLLLHRSILFYLFKLTTYECNHQCNVFVSNILFLMQKEMEQTLETKHEFVENVPQQEMPSVAIIPTNSKVI